MQCQFCDEILFRHNVIYTSFIWTEEDGKKKFANLFKYRCPDCSGLTVFIVEG